MYHLSTQYHQWLFTDDQLKEIRAKTNANFVSKRNPEERLTVEDEAMVLRYYEVQMKEFCSKFEPPMTTTAITIAVQYFKRFYLYNSVMNYHPKDIYLICVYLTCKTEEIRISISTFMENIVRNPTFDQTSDILLAYELVLIENLHFHLVVHTAHRPFEGLIIDLKTHYLRENVNDADRLRLSGYEFLEKTLTTDVYFLFPPSQIALTALVYASITTKVNIDDYILKRIYHSLESEEMQKIKDTIRSIATVVKNPSKYKKADVNKALEKLEKCYNLDLDPRSDQYKKDRLEQFQKLSDYEDKYLPQ